MAENSYIVRHTVATPPTLQIHSVLQELMLTRCADNGPVADLLERSR